jgi:hypothetical protein
MEGARICSLLEFPLESLGLSSSLHVIAQLTQENATGRKQCIQRFDGLELFL